MLVGAVVPGATDVPLPGLNVAGVLGMLGTLPLVTHAPLRSIEGAAVSHSIGVCGDLLGQALLDELVLLAVTFASATATLAAIALVAVKSALRGDERFLGEALAEEVWPPPCPPSANSELVALWPSPKPPPPAILR